MRKMIGAMGVSVAMAWGAVAAAESNHPLVGAIRWDAWYGTLPETATPPASVPYPGFKPGNLLVSRDPGSETFRSLAAEPWRYRWPFFTELNQDGSAKAFNGNRREVIEKEIEYAVNGGLDYWAFTTYPEQSPLSYSLKTFLSCKNRDKIKFCLFLAMWPAYGRLPDEKSEQAYWDYAARMIQQKNYLKTQGNRPVIFMDFLNKELAKRVLDGPWTGFTNTLGRSGMGKPYLVISGKEYCDQFGGDALGSYNVVHGGAEVPFADQAARAERVWEQREATGTPAVPICMTGWDRRPRVMNPVPWESANLTPTADQRNAPAKAPHVKRGSPEEIAEHIGRGVSWYRKHPGKNGTELVLIYAWNEFDEGGWLVPALPPPDGEGAARLDALRKVLRPKD